MCSHGRQVEPLEEEAVLTPLWNNVPEEVTEAEHEKLKDIILRYRCAFSLHEWDLGYTELVKHEIDTGAEPPVRQALRRQPQVQLTLRVMNPTGKPIQLQKGVRCNIIDEQNELMLRHGLIQKSC